MGPSQRRSARIKISIIRTLRWLTTSKISSDCCAEIVKTAAIVRGVRKHVTPASKFRHNQGRGAQILCNRHHVDDNRPKPY